MKLFIDKLLKIIFLPFSFFFIFIQLILYKFILIRIGQVPSHRIGHLAGDMAIYLNKKKYEKESRLVIDIFFSTKIISNKTLYNLIRKRILFFPQFIFFTIYKLLIFFKKFLNLFDKFIIHLSWYDSSGKITINNQTILKPSLDFYNKGDLFLNKLGISKNDKIVCLNIRDNAYLKNKFPNHDWNYHNHRNANVDNYLLTINELVNRGFYVFRMGEKVERKISISHPKFIDYANIHRTDFLDIYLARRCYFAISSGTGWDAVPSLIFKKPMAYVNLCPLFEVAQYASSKYFFICFKEYQDNNSKKKLNLKDLKEKNLLNSDFLSLENNNINIIENSPEDIKNTVIELLNFLDNNVNNPVENNNLFWKNFLKNFNKNKVLIKYKPKSKISSNFLNKIEYFYKI